MQLSARNQFAGRVKEVKLGNIMAEVVVDIGGGHEVVAAITRASAERLGLAQGSTVTVVIKATEVLVAKD
jgi:molybdopterin-binding protein